MVLAEDPTFDAEARITRPYGPNTDSQDESFHTSVSRKRSSGCVSAGCALAVPFSSNLAQHTACISSSRSSKLHRLHMTAPTLCTIVDRVHTSSSLPSPLG